MRSVSVVVVSFNTRGSLLRCLSSIDPSFEVLVVDNASSDGSAEMVEAEFPSARLIRNDSNRGFGPANNQGADQATCELVIYLNSDCIAEPGAIQRLASEFDDEQVVAAGGKLLWPDGGAQLSAANELTLWAVFCEQLYLQKLFPKSRLFSPYWVRRDSDESREVAQVMGACLMVRRGLERFDERFPLYCEDTELCRRLRGHGKILYAPQARFTHELGASSARVGRWRTVALYNRGKELYFAIHSGPVQMAFCWLLNRLGALVRLTAWTLATILSAFTVRRFRERAVMFWKVLTAPLSGPKLPQRSVE